MILVVHNKRQNLTFQDFVYLFCYPIPPQQWQLRYTKPSPLLKIFVNKEFNFKMNDIELR